MTTLLYYILKSRFWQQIVMTSPLNLGGEEELGKEGDASRKKPTENWFLRETRFLESLKINW